MSSRDGDKLKNRKLKVVVALTPKCADFDAFCEVVCSSPKIKNKVDFVFSENKEHLRQIISDASILVCMKIDKEAFSKANNLKWVHLGLAGVDRVLSPEMLKRKIYLTSSKGIHSTTVSELVMGMILAFAKGIVVSMSFKNKKIWGFEEVNQARFDLEGKVLGIVGLGNIGLDLAEKASLFGMKVYGMKNRVKRGERIKYIDKLFQKNKLEKILSVSDFVVLSVPYTKETHHLIGKKELSLMKEKSFLINISRGQVVDEKALIYALKNKKITGAGLDVFEKEPLPKENKLWELENVIITPHIGGAMPDYYRKVGVVFKENLERFLGGKRLKNLVDKKLGY